MHLKKGHMYHRFQLVCKHRFIWRLFEYLDNKMYIEGKWRIEKRKKECDMTFRNEQRYFISN